MRELIIYTNADNKSQRALYDDFRECLIQTGSTRYHIDQVIEGIIIGLKYTTDRRISVTTQELTQEENPDLYERLLFEN